MQATVMLVPLVNLRLVSSRIWFGLRPQIYDHSAGTGPRTCLHWVAHPFYTNGLVHHVGLML
jgi:hypothetical protein